MKQQIGLLFLYYLRFFARLQLAKIKLLNPSLKIIGITGSAGKTSCLLACESALTPQFKVKTNYGGNSESGIPLNILGLTAKDFSLKEWLRLAILSPIALLTNWQKYDILLLEMGIDSAKPPKNMEYLLTIVTPDIGIFLNVSSVHMQNFSSLEAIAQEKAKLVNTCPQAIINFADPLVKKYSRNPNQVSLKPITLKIPNYVLPQIYNITFGAAISLAKIIGLTEDIIKQNIVKNFHLSPGRSSLIKGIRQSQIIDSTYNSSPLSCLELLKLLKTFPPPRIAVLGDMRELGKASSSEHIKIYKYTSELADIIISVGPETKKYFGSQATKFSYWWQALEYLKQNLPNQSTMLIKGSQNTIFLEEIVKGLLDNPTDISLLCRQSPYWLKTKNKFKDSHLS